MCKYCLWMEKRISGNTIWNLCTNPAWKAYHDPKKTKTYIEIKAGKIYAIIEQPEIHSCALYCEWA